jgi:hypothetical protein
MKIMSSVASSDAYRVSISATQTRCGDNVQYVSVPYDDLFKIVVLHGERAVPWFRSRCVFD